ncbi:MOSC domain-containing protein [Deinococcus frigens]|uniref:MOSC domain-containing protein n=1 Tax=Deinococcus frigens TaxID=249403 RepID=UPI000557CF32|nr:MOSC domain-containing protein [Deinococcus frigens]
MKTIQDLRTTFPRPGRVEWLGLRPARRVTPLYVSEVEAHPLVGLIGDHGKVAPGRLTALSGELEATLKPSNPSVPGGPGKRQVTLIQAEHLPVIAALAGLDEVTPELLRRNIVVSGMSLLALKDARFQIGEVVLEGTGECHPCSRMEENLGEGGYNAVRGHGGLTARVVVGGVIRQGDAVTALAAELAEQG